MKFTIVDARFWRVLSVRWQRAPLSGAGAATSGGRWNRLGSDALYLAADHATAIAEFHQRLVRPGTLAAFDIASSAIVDLCDPALCAELRVADDVLRNAWRTVYAVEHGVPPSWILADRLIAAGADGALVPSAQRRGGTNLVLWRWSADGDAGARVKVIDPLGDLG